MNVIYEVQDARLWTQQPGDLRGGLFLSLSGDLLKVNTEKQVIVVHILYIEGQNFTYLSKTGFRIFADMTHL